MPNSPLRMLEFKHRKGWHSACMPLLIKDNAPICLSLSILRSYVSKSRCFQLEKDIAKTSLTASRMFLLMPE